MFCRSFFAVESAPGCGRYRAKPSPSSFIKLLDRRHSSSKPAAGSKVHPLAACPFSPTTASAFLSKSSSKKSVLTRKRFCLSQSGEIQHQLPALLPSSRNKLKKTPSSYLHL